MLQGRLKKVINKACVDMDGTGVSAKHCDLLNFSLGSISAI